MRGINSGGTSRRNSTTNTCCGISLDELLARFLKNALLETGPLSEEFLVRSGGCMVRVLYRCEFHGTDVVRRLRKPVLGGRTRMP